MRTVYDKPTRIVTVGAFSMDIVLPPGRVGRNHRPGITANFGQAEHRRVRRIAATPGHEEWLHLGGDGANVAAKLAVAENVVVDFWGVLGNGDVVSAAARTELGRFGIRDRTVSAPDWQPGIHIIERLRRPGSKQMVRRPPRPPEDAYLTGAEIRPVVRGADAVVLASLKSTKVLGKILAEVDEDTVVVVNPGVAGHHPEAGTLDVFRDKRRPTLWTANYAELEGLFQRPGAPPHELALQGQGYADNMLLTLGSRGRIWAANGDWEHQECGDLDPSRFKSKVGAGDASTAAATEGMLMGYDPSTILCLADLASTEAIQYEGGHEYLYEFVEPVTYSLDRI